MTCVDPWFHSASCDSSCAESPYATTESTRRVPGDENTCSVESGAGEAARSANSERPLDPPLDATESRPDVSVTAPPDDGLRTAAIELLQCHRDAIERERRTRLVLIVAARDHGLTYEEIGDALGMTDAGVRLLVKRSGGNV